jgi:filamentous hemagglutinin family protein
MSRYWRGMLLTTSALVPLTLAGASAGPNGASVVGGSATVQGQGTPNVVVNQTSQSAIINWNTFNIGAGERTTINMPSASSVELDRVTGGLGPSQILGSLSSNGRVFLVNPDGILFGSGSRVNVGGLLATTHDISYADFMAGRYNFAIPGNPSASIVNQGAITAQTGGFAALVAPGVRNTGTITATLGTIALASGNAFTLDLYGDQLIKLGVNDSIASQVIDVSTGKPLNSLVSNAGTLKANGGKVELTAVAARKVVDSVINNTGFIEANTIGRHNGTIVLGAATAASKPAGAPTQTVKVSGTLSTAGKAKGTTGGTVVVTGENIEVSGATINASGASGGGAVLIGGDWGGGHPNTSLVSNPSAYLEPFTIPTASTVSIDPTTTINASATTAGNGGKVVVWSDQATTFNGRILAQGGPQSGQGGFVETSGHQLTFNGSVNTSSPAGRTGIWLLDPTDLTIDSTAATTISQNLDNTNVILQTNANGTTMGPGNTSSGPGDIIIDAPISWTGLASLTLNAYNNVALNASISGSLGGLVINAGNSISATAGVDVGIFTLQNGAWSQVSPTLPTFSANSFQISGGSFLRALGGNGMGGSPYQITDIYGLQGIGSSPTLLADNYVLANKIQANTSSWNGGAGFIPIGSFGNNFTGTFNGQGYTISNLTINLPSSSYVGLFGELSSTGLVENVGVVGGSVSGFFEVGGLVGGIFGTIKDSYATDAVTGNSYVGGLVGGSSGFVIQSYATGTVTGSSGSSLIGGLIGANGGGTVIQSYAIGMVTAGSGSIAVGGLIGGNSGAAASSYWDTQTSGQTVSDGGIGQTTAQLQAGLPSGFDPTIWGSNSSINNGYPYLLSLAPTSSPLPPVSPTPAPSPTGTSLPPSTTPYWNGQVNTNFWQPITINTTAAGSTPPVINNLNDNNVISDIARDEWIGTAVGVAAIVVCALAEPCGGFAVGTAGSVEVGLGATSAALAAYGLMSLEVKTFKNNMSPPTKDVIEQIVELTLGLAGP